ncbi:beta-sarcoglycan-like [Mizuhopecten yessoensis]|uniref:Beta-sarcoglycan n=1 Tax=Mizuhopecten yessoensis TaxID=6573 RepID=A0A210Q977_MIZYE|nr:beta-sarcoglycan-like [Mizuhopecten yessoensis]OWF45286.1 Beta-sarcoglycan [Mizuhopecten yessoensis]
MDPYERGDASNMSMREKSTLKRRINREHNSNFRAGYININEPYLHKTGIRGRKRYFLYCVMTFLILLACANALLTAGIMYALKFSYFGVQSLEFIPESRLLRFLSDTTLSTVQIFDGFLGGRRNSSLVIQNHNGPVVFTADTDQGLHSKALKVELQPGSAEVTSVENFKVGSLDTGKMLLSTGLQAVQEWTSVASPGVNIHAPVVEVPVLESVPGVDGLNIESYKNTEIKGMEGLELSSLGKVYVITNNITLHSTDGSIIMDADKGVYLDSNLPRAIVPSSSSTTNAYKVCVCASSGRVFAVQVTGPGVGCGDADPDNDPCA